ncbi:crosslink repair DNA glycosylase YcaQ family protein [Kitasatospora sp. NPDC005748]|uniref:DNA glycosylase AlkZ-like family protein n=1 Tax=Kitasatospora sp. NPDC005748 TaxID=3157063 RepID=UPI003405475A
MDELTTIIADLRSEGSDFAEVEVKLAAGGFPQVAESLSAFANTPGGGTLILGLDEARHFSAVGVYDATACKKALASVARSALQPPVTLRVFDFSLEGAALVVAEVDEIPSSAKPCKVRSTGKAYLRSYDGDYEISQIEEQAFLANRETPKFDISPVPEAGRGDLNPDLVAAYLETCKRSSSSLARFSDEQILVKTGVVDAESGHPTLAGILALGEYPQQFFPNLVIQASLAPGPNDPAGTRAVDSRKFDGPIPVMLDEALKWVQRNTRSRVRFGANGHGRDEPEYPTEAVRELLSNALIHRDLGPYALPEPISLKLDISQLVLSNPGGLWGVTVDRLGKGGVSSARNGHLLRICQNVRFGRDLRVVEGLASGIPTVLESLSRAGMVPPRFHDQVVRFTVRVPNHTLLGPEDLNWLATLPAASSLDDTQRHALVAMRHGKRWTNSTLREAFPMDSREARSALAGLVDSGVAVAMGERGGRVYQLSPNIAGENGVARESSLTLFDSEPEVIGELWQPKPRTREAGLLNELLIKGLLAKGPMAAADIADRSGLTPRQVAYALSKMHKAGEVVRSGGKGRKTVYSIPGSVATDQ